MATAPAIDMGPIEQSINRLSSAMSSSITGMTKSVASIKEGYAKTAAATRTSFAKSLRESAKSSLGGQRGIAEAVRTMRADLIATGMSQQEAQSQALASINANIASQVESMKSSPVAIAKAMGTVSMDGMKFLAGKISGFFGKDKEEQNQEERRQGRMMTLFKKMDSGIGAMGKSLAQKGKAVAGSLFGMLKKGALMLAIPALIAFMKSPMFDKLKVWVVDTLIPALKNLVDIIVPIAQKLGAWVSDSLLPEFFDMLKKHWDSLTTMVSGIVDKVKVLFGPDATWNERIGALLGIFDDIGTFVFDAVRNLGVMILNLFGVDGEALAKKYWDPIANVIGAVVDWIVLAFTDPKAILDALWKGISNIADYIYNNALKPAWDWLTGLFKDPVATLKGLVRGFGSLVDWIFNNTYLKVWNWITGLFGWEPVANTFSLWDTISAVFTEVKTWFINLFTWGRKLGETKDGVWSLSTMIDNAFTLVKEWVVGLFTWGRAAGVTADGKWSLATMIDAAFLKVKEWAVSLFTWLLAPEGESWIQKTVSAAVTKVKAWATSLFTWSSKDNPDDPWLTTKIKAAINLVKDWVTGLFSWVSTAGQVDGKPWSLSTMIDAAVLKVIGWVKSLFTWATEPVGPEDSWIKKIVHDAIALVKTWALSLFTWADKPGGSWITLKVKEVIKTVKAWVISLFTWVSTAGQVDGKEWSVITLVQEIIGKAIGWVKSLFSWATSDEKTDPEGFSILGTVKAVIKSAIGWVTGLFTFASEAGKIDGEEWSLSKMIGTVLTRIKEFFIHPDGKSGVLQFDLLGSLPDFDLSGMFDKIGDMFSIDGILGGIGRKLEAQDWKLGFGWIKDILLKVFDPTKGVKAAMGGMVKADQWAMVGEKGPELVRFKQPSVVASNEQMHAGRDFAMNAMRRSIISQPPAGAGGGGSSTVMITNAPSTSNVANTKVETAAGVSDPHTQLAGVY